MCWYKSVKGFRSPEGCSYRIKDAEHMSVEPMNTQYDPSDTPCSLREVPYAILNMHYGRCCLDYVKNIFTGDVIKVEHILDSSTFASSSGEQLYFEDYSYSTKYRPVRCNKTGEVMPVYLVKDSYRLPGELDKGDVVRVSSGDLAIVIERVVEQGCWLLSNGIKSHPQFLHYVGRAGLLPDGSYIYQGLKFGGQKLNRGPKQEFKEDKVFHRLVLNLTDSTGQKLSSIEGSWVPSGTVASVEEFRAFHPDFTVPGLPQMFRVQE